MSNLQDLPPAQRLACLIEAGVAANPDLVFNGSVYWVESRKCGCALMFAARGAGVTVNNSFDVLLFVRDAKTWAGWNLLDDVQVAAFTKSLPEIIASLREGELSKVAV